jgi:hypothetical protein
LAEGFKKATVRQEAKRELMADFARALVASDIAFEKMDNPFLTKHVINGGAIPGADGLRDNLSSVYEVHRANLSAIFSRHNMFTIIADETTDAVGRCVLSILLIPDFAPSETNISVCPYVIDAVVLQSVNNSTVGGAIIRALVSMGIAFDSIVSDNAAYMKKAFREVLKPVLVNAVHVTCWAHVMSLLDDEWRKKFATVHCFVAKMKAIFVFSNQRKNSYISFMKSKGVEEPKMPHHPVLTRWNSSLLAVQQHDEYFSHYPELVEQLITEGHTSSDILALQNMLQQPARSTLFVEIKNISKMCEPIKKHSGQV